MSEENPPTSDLNSLGIDLAASFLPSWAKESDPSKRLARLASQSGDEERPGRSHGRPGPGREARGPRPGSRTSGEGRPDGRSRGPGSSPSGRGPREGGRRVQGGRRPERVDPPAPEPALEGWNVQFLPEPHGMEGIARQMKTDLKAYPLFDLAWLVLEKPDRYRVEFRRAGEDSPRLFQVKIDGSLWLSEREAVAHILARHLDKFYRREAVSVEPPKGAFPFVAVCGMSGTVLGPPNYHDYQAKLMRLYNERYANLPFEVYKSRIRMERDEALIQQWKDCQSTRDEFHPLEAVEGAEPRKWSSIAELEADFRENHMKATLIAIRDKAVVSGKTALESSASLVAQRVRRTLEELRRFPLPLAHTMGRHLTSKGLHLFKAHQKITYVSVARPKYLDHETMPVAEGVKAMIDYLETHGRTPRPDQWKALVALRQAGSTVSESEAESAMMTDLLWLLREGHVIDFARKGLEAARKPQPQPPPRKKQGSAVSSEGGPAPSENAVSMDSIPGSEETVEPADAECEVGTSATGADVKADPMSGDPDNSDEK